MHSPNCPQCGSQHTVSTPLAGPSAEFHCYQCDDAFTTSDCSLVYY